MRFQKVLLIAAVVFFLSPHAFGEDDGVTRLEDGTPILVTEPDGVPVITGPKVPTECFDGAIKINSDTNWYTDPKNPGMTVSRMSPADDVAVRKYLPNKGRSALIYGAHGPDLDTDGVKYLAVKSGKYGILFACETTNNSPRAREFIGTGHSMSGGEALARKTNMPWISFKHEVTNQAAAEGLNRAIICSNHESGECVPICQWEMEANVPAKNPDGSNKLGADGRLIINKVPIKHPDRLLQLDLADGPGMVRENVRPSRSNGNGTDPCPGPNTNPAGGGWRGALGSVAPSAVNFLLGWGLARSENSFRERNPDSNLARRLQRRDEHADFFYQRSLTGKDECGNELSWLQRWSDSVAYGEVSGINFGMYR